MVGMERAPAISDRRFLLRAEVGDLIRTPSSTLAQWAVKGIGPPFLKVGKRCLYPREGVERFLEERAQAMRIRMPTAERIDI
jgi:hypothetical protein